jgi:hypothetical protein
MVCAEEESEDNEYAYELDDDDFEELILTMTADSGAGNHIASRHDLGG